MKKVKLILSLSIIVLSLCYLSSCIRNSIEPKVYMYNPEVTFTTMEFDLKVVEPEEILIKEIYIKLYKENELEKTLSSNDDINKVGTTEDIVFRKLDPKTRYKLEFSFDYFEQDYENEDVVIYTYSFTTKEDTGISGSLSNYAQTNDGRISIDVMIQDKTYISSTIDFYLRKGDEIIKHINTNSTLYWGTNRYEFGPLLPNGDYVIELCASFLWNEEKYEDYMLDSLEISISNYYTAPTAKFSNVVVEEGEVTFDVITTDPNSSLKDYTIQLVDSNNAVLQEIQKSNLQYWHEKFTGLYPNTAYKLRFLASYQTPVEYISDAIIEEFKFKTDLFSILPKAEITLKLVSEEMVEINYSIKDALSLITSLRCEIRNTTDEIIQTIDLKKDSLTDVITLNKTSDLEFFKIQFYADYIYMFYEIENEIIGSMEYVENKSEDFEFDENSILKYTSVSNLCIIPKMIYDKEVKKKY